MKLFSFLLIYLFLASTFLFSQTTLITDELYFHSELEQQAFQLTSHDLEEHIIQLLAVNEGMNADDVERVKSKLEQHFKVLEAKGVRNKKIKKATQIIFDITHGAFLQKYEFYAEFHQIFENGVYDCVTASALYALIFDHFDIPYEIREVPSHVYVIAYPETENIIVETTDPINGVFSIDKEKYIEELIGMKIISQQEAKAKSVNELYKIYVEEDNKAINMKQLVGDLYYNASILAAQDDNHYRTYAYLKKAQAIYDKKMARLSEMNTLLLLAQKSNIEDLQSMKPLFMLLDFEEYTELVGIDLYNFNSKAAQLYLVDDYQPQKYERFYHYLMRSFDTEKYKEIADKARLVYYSQKAHSWRLQSKFEQAMVFADSAYQIAPNNLTIRAQLTQIIMANFSYLVIQEESTEKEGRTFIEKMETITDKYPFLKDNLKIVEIQFFSMYMSLDELKIERQRDKMAVLLEAIVKKFDDLPVSSRSIRISELVENSYYRLIQEYILVDDFDNAQAWLDKGFQRFPDSEELLMLQKKQKQYVEDERWLEDFNKKQEDRRKSQNKP